MLEVRGISVAYGPIRAVRDVSLAIEPGEVLGLVGRNGAGKTTTLRAIAGELRIMKGEVLLEGGAPARNPWSCALAGIRLVPEGHRVFGGLSVLQNLAVARAGMRRRNHSDDRPASIDDSEIFELFPALERRLLVRAGLLSGGEQQMLALAMGLLSRPRYLLVDELSLGLAPLTADSLAAVIRQIALRGVGVLLVEQEIERMRAVSDRLAVIRTGETVWEGPVGQQSDDQILAMF